MLAAATALVSTGAVAWFARVPRAAELELFPNDRVLGDSNAPVTIIEYSSLTCPHCATFHRDALPQIMETWIAEGKAKLVFRHFPLDSLALRAAAVANCIEGERHFSFLDILFKSQRRWTKASDPIKAIGQMARLAGLSKDKFETCVNDQAEMDRILARRQDGAQTYGVQSTPTLIINGEKVEGVRSFKYLNRIIENATAGI